MLKTFMESSLLIIFMDSTYFRMIKNGKTINQIKDINSMCHAREVKIQQIKKVIWDNCAYKNLSYSVMM